MISHKTPAHSLTLALCLTAAPLFAQWEKLPPMPEPNGGFAAGADAVGIVVAGGTNWVGGSKNWLQTLCRYDPAAKRWDTLGKLSEPLAYALCSVRPSDGSLVILGGSSGAAPAQALAFIKQAHAAIEPAPTLPRQLVLSAGGLIGGAFIIVGGTDDAANIAGFTNHAFAWDIEHKTLAPMPDYPGPPLGIAASAVLGGELLLFGGANWDAGKQVVTNTAAAHALAPVRKQWRKLPPYPVAVRAATAIALDSHRLYIAGGYGGEPEAFLATAYIFDNRSSTYTPSTPLPYAATVGLVAHAGYLYCLGGEDKMKSRTAAAWRLPIAGL